MKIKVFNIRLTKDYFFEDQEKVNKFLRDVNVKKSSTSFVDSTIKYWSILFHYEDLLPKEEPVCQLTKKNEISFDELTPRGN